MDTLNTLFGGVEKVRMFRLFLFNSEIIFDIESICEKLKIDKKIAEKEIVILLKSTLIRTEPIIKIISKKVRGKIKEKKLKVHGYILNQNFPHISGLRQLLINSQNLNKSDMVKRFSNVGKIKLILVSGVFIENNESRVDVLLVGNNIKKGSLSNIVKTMEAELGREISYAFFETPDFQYRIEMCDKLVRDIIDYPHTVLLNKLPFPLG
jgi:hypothetical protein